MCGRVGGWGGEGNNRRRRKEEGERSFSISFSPSLSLSLSHTHSSKLTVPAHSYTPPSLPVTHTTEYIFRLFLCREREGGGGGTGHKKGGERWVVYDEHALKRERNIGNQPKEKK